MTPCRIRRKTNIVYTATCAVTRPYSDEHDSIHRRLRPYSNEYDSIHCRLRPYCYVIHRLKSEIFVDFFYSSGFPRQFDFWEFKSTFPKVLQCEEFHFDVSWFLRRFDFWEFLVPKGETAGLQSLSPMKCLKSREVLWSVCKSFVVYWSLAKSLEVSWSLLKAFEVLKSWGLLFPPC